MRPAALALMLLAVGVPAAGSATTCTTRPAAAAIADLKLLSYYPSERSWTAMWTDWRPRVIDRDFGVIAGLGANAVRIVVAPRAAGYPVPRASFLRRLREVVRMAQARGLRVQLTLFDWWADYGDVAGARAWASAVLLPFARDPRVAFVELRNEIDPADPAAAAWARELLPHVREAACGAPVTLSAVGTEPGATVRALRGALGAVQPDFYDVHYFGRAELAHRHFAEARREAGGRPLLVGEVGYSTYVGNGLVGNLPRSRAAREAQQDHHLRMVQHAARSLGLPAAAPWAFADFRAYGIPDGGPREQPQEHHFGLFRVDGSPKPAAASLQALFAGGVLSTEFNNGFETGVGAGARDLPAAWQIRRGPGGAVARDRSVARSGAASLRLGSAGGAPSGRAGVHVSPIAGAVEEGRSYAASAWVLAPGRSGRTVVSLAWYDGAARLLGRTSSPPRGRAPAWTPVRVSGPAPAGAAFAQVELEVRGTRAAVWLDDVAYGPAG